jgi:uncharacterized protein YndB with AHSA1/START domain
VLARNRGDFSLTLPSDREIVMTRVFEAPRRRVFEAWTEPEHVRRWYGCGTLGLRVCEIDLRVGGSYCYVLQRPDGMDCALEGTYREIVPPERLVYTEEFVTRGFTSNPALVTVTFTERAGKTTLTVTILHRSREDRDAQLNSGMETGAAESLDRLAGHLATVA